MAFDFALLAALLLAAAALLLAMSCLLLISSCFLSLAAYSAFNLAEALCA